MKKKVAILYSNGGGGLRQLAENLALGFRVHYGDSVDVECFDPLPNWGLGDIFFNKIYNFWVRNGLSVNSLLVSCSYLLGPDRNWLIREEIRKSLAVKIGNCDLIICTSPWITEGIAHFLRSSGSETPLAVYVADMGKGAYHGWLNSRASQYFTSTPDAKEILAKMGADEKNIQVLGMPVLSIGKKESPGLKNVLLLSGMHGSNQMEKITRALLNFPSPLCINVLCGTDEKLRARLQQLSGRAGGHTLRVSGFIGKESVDALMRSSDIVITKPGALTIAEAAASRTPLLITSFPSIMPQEEGNAEFVAKNEIGYLCSSPSAILEKMDLMLSDGETLPRMRKRMGTLGFSSDPAACARTIGSIFRL